MYWLLDPQRQEAVRAKVTALADVLTTEDFPRVQRDQVFPFSGRKDRQITRTIIKHLAEGQGVICEPFMGSGIFPYAALELGHKVVANEWEPYAHTLSTAPFRCPQKTDVDEAFALVKEAVEEKMNDLYKTKCSCGTDHVLDSLFYDSESKEYFHPQSHERMGKNGENITYRGKYKCPTCKKTEKHFDQTDAEQMRRIDSMVVTTFPDVTLIENSRINLTAPKYTSYRALFPKRSQLVLEMLNNRILEVPNEDARKFLLDALICILPQAKHTDYRAKSQDLHCPPNKNRENNIWHRFCDKVNERMQYLLEFGEFPVVNNWSDLKKNPRSCGLISCKDFRDFLQSLPDNSCDMVMTDPPYGDAVPYFEKAQLYHPFLPYSLISDAERLAKEVVITNAPSRTDKHDRDQFIRDIETMFKEVSRVLKTYSYFVLYFRPEQGHWIRDLNTLKLYARKYGLEPLITIDVATDDPSMRVLASTAWTFASDVVFLFLKLDDSEKRWYEAYEDVDCLVYSAALQAAGSRGEPFTLQSFNEKFATLAREKSVPQIVHSSHKNRIEQTLMRFASKDGARYILSGVSPYQDLHHNIDPEIRVREFIPIVMEELSAEEGRFQFHKFVLRLSTYLDNGSRSIINRLNDSEGRLKNLLLEHAEIDEESGLLRAKTYEEFAVPEGTKNVIDLTPKEFEDLVGELLRRKGFTNISVIGQSCDRGVDVLARGAGNELYIIQCKRYRPGNNIGSSPVQRVDSYRRTRGAQHAWVITTSDFTREGISEGNIANVKLINGHQLMELLNQYFPEKYHIHLE